MGCLTGMLNVKQRPVQFQHDFKRALPVVDEGILLFYVFDVFDVFKLLKLHCNVKLSRYAPLHYDVEMSFKSV